MSIVIESKRRTHSKLCLHPSTSVTHSTAQPTLTQKFSGSHSPLLISHCFTLFHSFCVSGSREAGERYEMRPGAGSVSMLYWPCVRLQAAATWAAFQWKHRNSVIFSWKDYTRHRVWFKTTHNCFHSEEDLNNIFPSISCAMAKVNDNTFLENVKTPITIYYIYQG